MRLSVNKKIIIGVLVCILLVGFLGWLTSGFTDFTAESMGDKFEGKTNEDNLYTAEACELESQNDGSGIIINVDDNGAISVKGTNNALTDATYTIGKVSLKAGTYTLTAVKGGSLSTYYVEGIAGDEIVKADFSGNTFTLEEDSIITLRLIVKSKAEINAKVLPVIVLGTESGEFYA